jgi:hypothetical protein
MRAPTASGPIKVLGLAELDTLYNFKEANSKTCTKNPPLGGFFDSAKTPAA